MQTLESFDLTHAVARDRTHLRLSSRVEWVEKAVIFLKDRALATGACDPDAAAHLVCALTEALTNAIVHGNLEIASSLKEARPQAFAEALAQRSCDPAYAERSVDIVADFDGRRCTWTITDEGPGFDVIAHLQRLDREDDPAPLLCSGRGIMLMRAFMSEVAWSHGGRQVSLTLNSPGDQRRAQPRRPAAQPVRLVPVHADGSVDAHAALQAVTLDLSAGGAAVLHAGLPHASRLLIEMNLDGRAVYVPAHVCHVRHLPGDMVHIGCRFEQAQPTTGDAPAAANAQTIDSLLAALAPADTGHDERRSHQRAAFTAAVELAIDPDEPRRPAVSRDLSKSGMALITEYPLRRGQVVELHVSAPGGQALRTRARVVRCQHLTGSFHDIGVSFAA